jgi:hypothetical protein
VNVAFDCPACQAPDRFNLPQSGPWRCVVCGHETKVSAAEADGTLKHCALCGNSELYRRKDFPQWIGLSILAIACTSFFVLQVLYHPWIAWSILLGSAAIDGLLYYGIVGDVIVCYRCGCQHRGVPSRSFDPHELAIAERYRQERIRQEQLRAAGGPRRDS